MKLSRRKLLGGVAAISFLPRAAHAWFPRGVAVPIGHGWNTLPLGAGGLVTGFSLANDNSIYCRTDVGNGYKWSGKTSTTTTPSDKWNALLTINSLSGLTSNPYTNYSWGFFELVCAPVTRQNYGECFRRYLTELHHQYIILPTAAVHGLHQISLVPPATQISYRHPTRGRTIVLPLIQIM